MNDGAAASGRFLRRLHDAYPGGWARLAVSTGADAIGEIVTCLIRGLDVDVAFVGAVRGDDWSSVHTLAVAGPDGPLDGFQYDLRGSPCAEVLRHRVCEIRSGVTEQFPEHTLLADLGIQSYLGTALVDRFGRPLGLLVVLRRTPMPADDAALAREALETFRQRALAELSHRHTVRELGELIEGVTSSEGDALRNLVQNVGRSLRVKVAFISRVLDIDRGRVRTLAMDIDGKLADDLEYCILDTPCEKVYEKPLEFFPDRVYERFPNDEFLQQIDAEGYIAIGFRDAGGKPLGHLGVIHDQPLSQEVADSPLLRAFAQQTAAELRRRDLEDQRIALERQLLEWQKVESLGVLAGGIAHDFNNLLTGVIGNLELARPLLGDTDEVAHHIAEAERASERAALLCNQMLAYAGRTTLNPSTVDLNHVVRDMRDLLAVSIAKSTDLITDLTDDLPIITADPAQLQQVIMNLITNASDALDDEPGAVTITTDLWECDREMLRGFRFGAELPPGPYLVLTVRDTGRGMDAATIARMFDPFFSTKPEGHGLGLAALAGIMRRHRGAVAVESALDQGTAVTVLLPTAPSPIAAEPARVPNRNAGPVDATVLVVDDEPAVLKVATAHLERDGFTVITAENGRTAVSAYQAGRGRIDCVVLDLTMPDMSGEETLRRLREIDPNVRAVIASGFAAEEMVARMGANPIAGVLHKPYSGEELRRTVRAAVQGAPIE